MKTKNCESCFTIIDQIKEFFEKHLVDFSRMVQYADDYNGCLGDDRLYPMEELDECLNGLTPEEVIQRAFNVYQFVPRLGRDTSSSLSSLPFNPNDDYFYFNGYANLVSVPKWWVPYYYSKFIDRDHVEAIFEVWDNEGFCSFDDDDELDRLFMALSEFVD